VPHFRRKIMVPLTKYQQFNGENLI